MSLNRPILSARLDLIRGQAQISLALSSCLDRFQGAGQSRFPEAHRKGLRMATRLLGVMSTLARWGVLLLMVKLGLVSLDAIKKLPPDLRETAERLMLQPRRLRFAPGQRRT